MKIEAGKQYRTRSGSRILIETVKPTGWIEGWLMHGRKKKILLRWSPGGRWMDAEYDSQMDLVQQIGANK